MKIEAFQDISEEELQALIQRAEHAVEHGLALEVSDIQLLICALHSLVALQSTLKDRDITLRKLRKLLGIINPNESRGSTSKKGDNTDSSGSSGSGSGKKSRRNSTSSATKKPKPPVNPIKIVHHEVTDFKKGDTCPQCQVWPLKAISPLIFFRVTASAPYSTTKHVIEQLECKGCGFVVKASVPEEVTRDGDINQQYGYTARATMAIKKYFSGSPYNHEATLNQMLGCPVSSSTQYDQCVQLVEAVTPVYEALIKEAANCPLIHTDDTHNKILEETGKFKPKRKGNGERWRTGVHTSGVIGVKEDGSTLHLFHTHLGYSGEYLDSILKHRLKDLPPPKIACDALSHNLPTALAEYILCLCNAHGRRQFIDVEHWYPSEITFLLDLYDQIWAHERIVKDKELNDDARLNYHREHSLPIMEQIRDRCLEIQSQSDYEANSAFGKAIEYFLKHYPNLIQFCRVPGAPIDNNPEEADLKVPIRSRKNSFFFKTQKGADVANVLMSLITTAYRNGVNPFIYLVDLQRHQAESKVDPIKWLPYNYASRQASSQEVQKDEAA